MLHALTDVVQAVPTLSANDTFVQALQIGGTGMVAIFVVMGAFILLITLLGRIFPENSE